MSKSDGARGFTLLELIVTIGVIAVVSAGVAAIFESVSKTVSAGRRTSARAELGSRIERQLRADISAMTRDGFLVIRQVGVDTDGDLTINPSRTPVRDVVRLSPEDTAPRTRRIDELMFFARGEFASARRPIVGDVPVKANEARVYYGHGQRRLAQAPGTPGGTSSSLYLAPSVADENPAQQGGLDVRLGMPNTVAGSPNLYARDWTLLRHVTLLARPGGAATFAPVPHGLNPTTPGLADGDTQVSLERSASSVFRSLARISPLTEATQPRLREEGYWPIFNGGIVDIATTDLQEVRTTVTSFLNQGQRSVDAQPIPGELNPGPDLQIGQASARAIGRYQAGGLSRISVVGVNLDSVDLQHAWMAQAMPTNSDPTTPANPRLHPEVMYSPLDASAGVRLRYEPFPPNLSTTWSGSAPGVTLMSGAAASLEQVVQHSDQLMLSSSNFLERCTEFIVEWSFGETDTTGGLVWYGLRRFEDLDGNGRYDLANDRVVTEPYPRFNAAGQPVWSRQEVPAIQQGVGRILFRRNIYDRLVYGYQPRPDDAVLTSYFGFTDPTFDPTQLAGTSVRAIDSTLEWPWPKLLRVTVSVLVDPTSKSEETFQYVFELPDWNGRS